MVNGFEGLKVPGRSIYNLCKLLLRRLHPRRPAAAAKRRRFHRRPPSCPVSITFEGLCPRQRCLTMRSGNGPKPDGQLGQKKVPNELKALGRTQDRTPFKESLKSSVRLQEFAAPLRAETDDHDDRDCNHACHQRQREGIIATVCLSDLSLERTVIGGEEIAGLIDEGRNRRPRRARRQLV